MAVATVTRTNPANDHQSRLSVYTFGSMANGDTGTPIDVSRFNACAISVTGTFGVGGSVALQGSVDGTNYFALKNSAGSAVAITAAGGDVVNCMPVRFIRPAVTAGDGSTALVVVISAHTPV